MVKGWAIQQVQQAALRQILLISVGGILLILAVGSFGIYWLSGHALHPVRELAHWVSRVDIQTLDKRFVLERPEDEVKQLAEAFNRLLDRLEQSLEQQQRFVSDAAHELRTPFATLRTSIETVRSDPTATLQDYLEMTATLEQVLGRLERLTEGLLLLTRHEQQVAHAEVFLWPLLEDVLLDMEPLAKARAIHVHLSGDPEVVIQGDYALLIVVFRNLIENAIALQPRRRHGHRSPGPGAGLGDDYD
ncbi:MAG: HAMP domain-containing sensor histidine kinase [Ardenticatenia bacterium]|nr:HAMP domain-containing sensor histidine kinase [Ardenticatenia bacterium]